MKANEMSYDNPIFTIQLDENVRPPQQNRIVVLPQPVNSACSETPTARTADATTTTDDMTLEQPHRRTRWKLLWEVLIICTVFTLLILMEFGILPEIQNIGFYCGDPKIAHKFTGDTINIKVLLSVTLILPLILVCGVEWGCHGAEGYAKRGGSRWAWLPQSLLWYREYLSGLLIVFFLTDVAKVLVGEPRPHFLDTCKPFQAFNCSSGYIPNYTCSNNELSMWRVRDASKSFPSGHAAISIYLFTFSAWFLQKRMCGVSVLIVAWLQVMCLAWALACSLTRITDHRHHWWDVLAGSILGFIVGIYTVDHFCCCFRVGSYKNLTASGIKTGSLNDLKANGTLFHDTASARRLLTSTSSYSAEQHIQGINDVTLT